MIREELRGQMREEIQAAMQAAAERSQFNVKSIPLHKHDGIDSPRIKEDSLIQSVSVSGRITFAQVATYTILLNASFTPTNILAYGNVTGGAQRYFTFGSANLVPSFYLQPNNDTSVVTGNIQYPFIDPNINGATRTPVTVPLQSSSYFGAESAGGTMHTLAGEGHLVDIQFPLGTTHARATVTDFSRDSITIVVTNLDSGWEINVNIVIT